MIIIVLFYYHYCYYCDGLVSGSRIFHILIPGAFEHYLLWPERDSAAVIRLKLLRREIGQDRSVGPVLSQGPHKEAWGVGGWTEVPWPWRQRHAERSRSLPVMETEELGPRSAVTSRNQNKERKWTLSWSLQKWPGQRTPWVSPRESSQASSLLDPCSHMSVSFHPKLSQQIVAPRSPPSRGESVLHETRLALEAAAAEAEMGAGPTHKLTVVISAS